MNGLRRLALPALAAALLAAAPVGGAAAVRPPAPDTLTLRLVDIGRGYAFGEYPGCGVIAGEGATQALTQIYVEHRHTGCSSEFTELWAPADAGSRPRSITSAAYRFRDTAGPTAELQHARDVIAYVTGLRQASLTPLPTPALGDEAVAFETDDALVLGHPHQPGAVVLWRSDRVLALVLAADLHADVVAEATRLASVQQQRIEHPTPLAPADNDDVEVRLDDPGLDLKVPWLGRHLRPGGRLPALTLMLAGGAPSELGDVRLEYGPVSLYIWRRPRWRRFAKVPFVRLGWHERCVRATRIPVKGGVAVIYAGHERRQARCGRPPDRFFAHVFLRDVMVSVNPMICIRCREWDGSYDHDPYDSMAGMRAVVRALRLREPRALTP